MPHAIKDRTVAEINRKIRERTAVVLAEEEFRCNTTGRVEADVVTVSFTAETTEAAVMLCVPVAPRGVFTSAERIWLNGVPGHPGPAPNERLGLVDTLVFADQTGIGHESPYAGRDLFRDLLRGSEIEVECLSVESDTYRNRFTLKELQFARMYVYNCLLSDSTGRNLNVLRFLIRPGMAMFLNGSRGLVVGSGTRSTPGHASLSLAADLFPMNPDLIGESRSGVRTVTTNTVALAMPLLTAKDHEAILGLPQPGEGPSLSSLRLKELILKGEFLLTCSDMEARA